MFSIWPTAPSHAIEYIHHMQGINNRHCFGTSASAQYGCSGRVFISDGFDAYPYVLKKKGADEEEDDIIVRGEGWLHSPTQGCIGGIGKGAANIQQWNGHSGWAPSESSTKKCDMLDLIPAHLLDYLGSLLRNAFNSGTSCSTKSGVNVAQAAGLQIGL